MAKKKELDRVSTSKMRFWDEMRDETVQAILAIFSFLLTLLSLLAAFHRADGRDYAGPIGDYAFSILTQLFGVGYYLIPIAFAMLGVSFLRGMKKRFEASKAVGTLIFFISGLGLIHIASIDTSYANAGGIIGRWIALPLIKLMDVWATSLLLGALLITALFIVFEAHVTMDMLLFWKRKPVTLDEDEEDMVAPKKSEKGTLDDDIDEETDEDEKPSTGPTALEIAMAELEAKKKSEEAKKPAKGPTVDFDDNDEAFAAAGPTITLASLKPFTPPPLTLLEKDKGKPETGDIKANANIIKRTLLNFGITVEMDEISIGPSVTRYSLKPAEGVKLSRIVALNNDLSLALAAHPIRIEAPIPGKSLVGIEVPNTAKTTVGLATLLGSPDFQESEKPLLMSLGKDIAGKAHFSNLAKAPHMLIAGATGSGKSVTIHAVITSLLYRNSPEALRFIMIDPKRVELTLYNKIPHLLTPVITDPKKAIIALKWAAKEMGRRYDILEKNQCRDIDSYHKTVLAPAMEMAKKSGETETKLPETMPYIVVIIDELADIMQTYPRELESAIVRLAQMSRAIGIHLIISTQRPSVNVITGLIKANIPTRVALQVASQIDSRTILDQQGAEKLLGAGDMLYLGGDMSKPVRLQSAYISEGEVKKVAKQLADDNRGLVMNEINLTPTEPGSSAAFDSMSDAMSSDSIDDEDELYETAREAVVSANKASTSYLQRRLGIGYSRAAKLIDLLEKHGVIGPANGSKARDVIGGGGSSASIESAADALLDAAEGAGNEER